MQLQLYRPIIWWAGGMLHADCNPDDVTPYEAALLVQMRRATFIPDSISMTGETMTEDYSSALKLITPPASEPISLATAKLFLRVEHSADDAAIVLAISAARQFAEQYLRMALLPQTWDYSIANPSGISLRLPFGPAQSITSVTFTDGTGATSVVPATNYRLSVDGYAVVFGGVPNTAIATVRFVASSAATAADIPAAINQGMLHHIAVMMETRDGAVALPMQSVNCYQPYRRVSL